MADAVVELIGNKLYEAIQKEARLQRGARNALADVQKDLTKMRALLERADKMSDTNPLAKDWVKNVRALAYEAEDCIEEFTARYDRRGNVCSRTLHRMKARHQISKRTLNLRTRLKDLMAETETLRLGDPQAGTSVSTTARYDPRLATMHGGEDYLVGVDEPVDTLVWWLLDKKETGRRVVAVYGSGGLGKTALVYRVWKSRNVSSDGHFDCLLWLTVSQSFDEVEFTRTMSRKLFVTEKVDDTAGTKELSEKIYGHLSSKRYLIVVDDVWDTNAWDYIQHLFPENNNGSRVMVTTRYRVVAYRSCSPNYHRFVYEHKPLSHEHSQELFFRKVFGKYESCPAHLNDVADEILNKCRGMPLAINSIGSLLASKPDRTSREEWFKFRDHLGSELHTNSQMDPLRKIMEIGYDDLPYNLKPCFLSISIFPDDSSIDCKIMQGFWVAEGFVQPCSDMTAEDVAEAYVNELFNRSLIQATEISDLGKVKTFTVHDIMLEFIVAKSNKESFGIRLREHSKPNTQEHSIWRLSFHEPSVLEQVIGDQRLARARTLIKLGDELPSSGFSKLRFLRVLVIRSCYRITNDQLSEISKLRLLKYLDMRHSKLLGNTLPSSFRELQNLEMLDIRVQNNIIMPDHIVMLKKLRRLKCNKFLPPKGFGALKALETVDEVYFNPSVIKELEKLTQLKRLSVVGLTEENVKNFGILLKMSSCLTSLKVAGNDSFYRSVKYVEHSEAAQMQEYLGEVVHPHPYFAPGFTTMDKSLDLDYFSSPPPSRRSLRITLKLDRLPKWISSLRNLSKLVLKHTFLKDDAIHVIQFLPSLSVLQLREHSYITPVLRFCGGGFQSLKVLTLSKLHNLEVLVFEDGTMPQLTIISLHALDSLQSLQNISHESLPRLKEVRSWTNQQQLADMLQQAVESHPSNPKAVERSPNFFGHRDRLDIADSCCIC